MAEITPNTKGFFGGLWDTISGFFEAQFSKVWSGFTEIFWKIIAEISEKLTKWTNAAHNSLYNSQITAWKERGWIDDDTANEIDKLTHINFPFNFFSLIIVTLSMNITIVKQLLYTTTTDIKRALFARYHPEDIQGQTVIPASFIDPAKSAQITQIMLQNGYPKDQIDLLFFAMQRLYDENTIRVLYFREVLTEEQTYERMRNLGYRDERITEIIQSWPVIPSISDILFMVKKEAFKPDIVAKYGYGDEFPTDQLEYIQAQGLSEEWARRYWFAHWELPSVQMGFDMLHRGIIDEKTLNDLMVVGDIPPYWREKLTAIAYTPFTRVDARRMHQLKVLNDDELLLAYMDIGYDYDKALKMVEFTKALNNEERTNLTKSEILTGYSQRFITKEDATSMLTELKFNTEEIDYFLTYSDYQADKDIQTKTTANIKTMFTNRFIDETTARTKLAALNLRGNQIDVLMENWQLDIITSIKQPTKAELDNLVKREIITLTQYTNELGNLGYTTEKIGWYVQLLTPAPKKVS
jgi:hypothetical protein